MAATGAQWQACWLPLLAALLWTAPVATAWRSLRQQHEVLQCGKGAWASKTWGCDGGNWQRNDPESRLMDWSYAGYMAGYEDIPETPSSLNVMDYGAVGDNRTDDTMAFMRAIQDTPEGAALYVPAGVYKITKRLNIMKPMVIRGAGPEKTILYAPLSLTMIYGNSYHWPPSTNNSDYCWDGGFISAAGTRFHGDIPLGKVLREGARGDQTLKLSTTAGVKAGAWLVVLQQHKASKGQMSQHLYAGMLPGVPALQRAFFNKLFFFFKVTKVDHDKEFVTFDRPLPFDIRPEWGATVYHVEPDLHHVGVEDLAIHFPPVLYDGHHNESGYNGVFFKRVMNSWIKNVAVHNADNAVLVKISHLNTVDGVKFTSVYRDPDPAALPRSLMHGHMGVGCQGGGSNLIKNFNISTYFAHDLLVDSEINTVFTNGSGIDVRTDHHRASPYGNLYANIDAGEGTRLLDWRGPKKHGPHSGAYTTLYNIRTRNPVDFFSPVADNGPILNFIGVDFSFQHRCKVDRWEPRKVGMDHGASFKWLLEPTPKAEGMRMQPASLYDGMVQARRMREGGRSKGSKGGDEGDSGEAHWAVAEALLR